MVGTIIFYSDNTKSGPKSQTCKCNLIWKKDLTRIVKLKNVRRDYPRLVGKP